MEELEELAPADDEGKSVHDLVGELYEPEKVADLEEAPAEEPPLTDRERTMMDQLVDKMLEE